MHLLTDTPQDCRLDIVGTQTADGESITTETHCFCSACLKNNTIFIRYEEDGIKRLVTVTNDTLEMRTLGSLPSHLIFTAGSSTVGEYHTPYGCLTLAIQTSRLKITDSADTLTIETDYSLGTDGTLMSVNSVVLSVTRT